MDKKKKAIIDLYKCWREFEDDRLQNTPETTVRLMFLSNGVVGLNTYDDALDYEYGKMIHDTMIQIKEGTTFEYIKNPDDYRKYITSCNFIDGWIDWGTSIRGAFFAHDGRIIPSHPLMNTDYGSDYIETDREFMGWFVEWLKG